MDTKISTAQKNATNAYRKRSLANLSIVISEHETDIYEALQTIIRYHEGNKAQAVKQAIMAYALSLPAL